MNRTLKRPMFRKGGTPNEGIMSGLKEPRQGYNMGGGIGSMVRQNYAEGDSVIPANTQEYRDYLKQELYPKNTLIGDTNRLLGNVNDFLFNTTVRPIGNLGNYIVGRKEGLNTIKKRDYEDVMVNRILRAKGIDPDAEIKEPEVGPEPEGEAGPKPEGEAGPGPELEEADLKTVYADLLPMFKEALGTDDDELNRQKYLELARFGTNLLAQPGGDLTGAVGKAAAPSIEGLARIADAQRQADKLPAKYALEAALKEIEPGQIGKSVRDLMKLGYTKKQALRKIVDEGTGSATREQTLSREIDADASALLSGDIVKNEFEGRKLAKQLFKEGIGIEEISKLPEDKDDLIEGGIYIDKGIIKKYKKGKLYKRGEKGFK